MLFTPLMSALTSRLPVSVPPVNGSLVESATVMFADPLKLTPLIVRAVCRTVAVEALPVRAAVIVPAAKLPEASRATTLACCVCRGSVYSPRSSRRAVEVGTRKVSAASQCIWRICGNGNVRTSVKRNAVDCSGCLQDSSC
jgi:hypothetical protein